VIEQSSVGTIVSAGEAGAIGGNGADDGGGAG